MVKKDKETKTNNKPLGYYISILVILNLIFSLCLGFLLNVFKINNPILYSVFLFVLCTIISLYYIMKNKELIKNKDSDLFVYSLIIILMYFGVGALFLGLVMFFNGIRTIYSYDIFLLGLFCTLVAVFLWKKRKNLKKDGPMYLYPTKVGIKLIDYIGTKYKKTITVLAILAIISGYILMITMIFSFIEFVYIYLFKPEIVRMIKIPPVMPLVPYVPELFNIKFLKPFYFTYWIVAIACIAIFHEFAHGIVARRYGIKIKSTGFGFLGPFLAAFVEPDEKQMQRKPKYQQIAVLCAGTFTNLLLAIIFFILLFSFFTITYAPTGAMFNIYSPEVINTSSIQMIDNYPVNNLNSKDLLSIIKTNNITNDYINDNHEKENLTKVIINKKVYFIDVSLLKEQLSDNSDQVYVYKDLPAVKLGMQGVIVQINSDKITTYDGLASIMKKYKPGDNITVITKVDKEYKEYKITLGEDDTIKGKAVMGIGYIENKRSGIIGHIVEFFNFYQKSGTFYEPRYNAELILFIYNLFWWLALINLSVAIVNMMPLALFDGGRTFMLTMWGITGSKKFGEFAFKFMTYLILGALVLIMLGWAWAVFGI